MVEHIRFVSRACIFSRNSKKDLARYLKSRITQGRSQVEKSKFIKKRGQRKVEESQTRGADRAKIVASGRRPADQPWEDCDFDWPLF
jgi:hypothetical protein